MLSSIAKFIVACSMLFIAVNNEYCMLDIYKLGFTNDLPARKLPTQTLPDRFHLIIGSRFPQLVISQL